MAESQDARALQTERAESWRGETIGKGDPSWRDEMFAEVSSGPEETGSVLLHVAQPPASLSLARDPGLTPSGKWVSSYAYAPVLGT